MSGWIVQWECSALFCLIFSGLCKLMTEGGSDSSSMLSDMFNCIQLYTIYIHIYIWHILLYWFILIFDYILNIYLIYILLYIIYYYVILYYNYNYIHLLFDEGPALPAIRAWYLMPPPRRRFAHLYLFHWPTFLTRANGRTGLGFDVLVPHTHLHLSAHPTAHVLKSYNHLKHRESDL